ncbi:arylsulfatase [Sphingobacterium haloxyli]|uniref:Arylsulfatase n=1 Tax=Sphingobacterium haloxyli TaxID=2100533 RepID=A0A2S9J871_9SPHI|nr:arylsulfatase [Sphingobacterium haloxyli]PRD48947.1 arylsulfatase [Sphingobacterium haloxyli]
MNLQTVPLIVLLLSGMIISATAQQRKPNIVFILTDDLGIGDIGSYGQEKIKTPNLDKLASRGMRFENFYSGTSVCAPSRSALMTGQHTGHTYIRGNKEVQPEGQEPLADSIATVAMLLKKAGYTTGAFGKWGLGMVGTSGDPLEKGFDEFYGYNCQRQSHRYYPTHLWHNAEKMVLEGNNLQQKIHYAPELIQQKTLAFIEENQHKPFFLFVPTVLPHAELAGPNDEFYQQYSASFPETAHKGNDYGPHATIPGYASVEKPRATFAAMVSRLDNYVGEIVDKLEQLGLSENTLIIFTSDNGAHREGGADPQFFNSSAGLKGYKRDLYEGGIRVPMLAVWPGKISPANTMSLVAAFWDVLPTLAEVSGVSIPDSTDGISILPTLTGKGKQRKHRYLYWEFHEDGGRQAVRSSDWKLVRLKVKDGSQTIEELYNLKNDPAERDNIIRKHGKIAKKLGKYIDEAHRESPIFPLIKQIK